MYNYVYLLEEFPTSRTTGAFWLQRDHPLGFATISQVHQGIVRIHVLAATEGFSTWLFHGFSMVRKRERLHQTAMKLP